MKKKLIFPALLLSAVLLAAVLMMGRYAAHRAGDAGLAEETNAVASEVPGGEETTPEPTPAPTPKPTPAPTPTPVWTPPALREPELCESELDTALFEPAEHRGTVSLVKYTTRDHVADGNYTIEKDMAVYLPYGYDESSRYDVLILLHCAWADHRFWLAEDREYRTAEGIIPVSVPNILDHMIEEGLCRPTIVASPCIYLFDGHPNLSGNAYDYAQFTHEVGDDLLPYLAENYATYAADGNREALREAREHFGFLGASFGAYTEHICVIADNFDLAAWYTFCGGGAIDPGTLVNKWAEKGTSDLPLRLLLVSEGEFDDRQAPELSVMNLHYYGGKFTEDNVIFRLVPGWGHEDHSYLVGLYNTLQLFFRDAGEIHVEDITE